MRGRDPRERVCPRCGAPRGAPCADLRTYDRYLFGTRVHRERSKVKPAPLFVDVPLPFDEVVP